MYIHPIVFIIFITIMLLGDLVMAAAYIRLKKQRDELSESIHVTAHECYGVGWDHAMEVAREQYRIHMDIRDNE